MGGLEAAVMGAVGCTAEHSEGSRQNWHGSQINACGPHPRGCLHWSCNGTGRLGTGIVVVDLGVLRLVSVCAAAQHAACHIEHRARLSI